MGKSVRNMRKQNFVSCPTCKSLGYQTRRCWKGHTFGFDKWIADRITTITQVMGDGR